MFGSPTGEGGKRAGVGRGVMVGQHGTIKYSRTVQCVLRGMQGVMTVTNHHRARWRKELSSGDGHWAGSLQSTKRLLHGCGGPAQCWLITLQVFHTRKSYVHQSCLMTFCVNNSEASTTAVVAY